MRWYALRFRLAARRSHSSVGMAARLASRSRRSAGVSASRLACLSGLMYKEGGCLDGGEGGGDTTGSKPDPARLGSIARARTALGKAAVTASTSGLKSLEIQR